MFEEALRLRRKSYTYREILNQLQRNYGVKPAKATVSSWIRGTRTPLNAGHQFKPEPTPELAYIMGVETGDGFLNVKRKDYQYRIRLRAVDPEFVEAFNQAVAKVLRCPPHRLWKGKTTRETEVEFGSYLLHKFLLQPLFKLRAFIEHDSKCAASFLKGFFDSEGCVERSGRTNASNTDVALLRYVRHLLRKFFGIETTDPRISSRKGSILTRRGKSYVRRADCYEINIRSKSLLSFRLEIGMTIRRKLERWNRALGPVS